MKTNTDNIPYAHILYDYIISSIKFGLSKSSVAALIYQIGIRVILTALKMFSTYTRSLLKFEYMFLK